MSSLTRTIPLLGAALVCAAAATACKSVNDVACPMMHCAFEGDEGVKVTLTNAVERLKGELPVTLNLCAADKCTDLSLRLEGTKFACDSKDIRAQCKVRDDGGIEIGYAVELPDKEVAVHVTAKNEAGKSVYDETKSVNVDERKPSDLDCPQVCREAEIVFSPPPPSQ